MPYLALYDLVNQFVQMIQTEMIQWFTEVSVSHIVSF